ncbi:MAG: tyrosine-type recombinase/integrase [Planctomycetes bacterium]|nr:tyrosine-type recombinase/integrase [Planctomycetota bacterium]
MSASQTMIFYDTDPETGILALGRYAGLRRSEALYLRWNQIDWDKLRLTVISTDDFTVKDKEPRTIPIMPELREVLERQLSNPERDFERVIPTGSINTKNITRDFTVLCQRANVMRYHKPLHTLRKTCITWWARSFPQHVVSCWAGHSDESTTTEYYCQVSEQEYDKAAGISQPEPGKNRKLS